MSPNFEIQNPTPITIAVGGSEDRIAAVKSARKMAQVIGFDEKTTEEIALVVSELSTNLVKHASGGRLHLMALENGVSGIQIESHDNGPGFADVEQAIMDGFSTSGSLGCGLGTINRLMDKFDIHSKKTGTNRTQIICKRYKRPSNIMPNPCPLEFGAATRTYPQQRLNGDAFVIKTWQQGALVGVIDGLGHGSYAFRAAQKARNYIETHFDRPLRDVFRGVQRECRTTRGVVMALAQFDFAPRDVVTTPGAPMNMSFASVGNIEARVCNSSQPVKLLLRRGIVGKNAPNPLITEVPWNAGHILVLHSDGLSTHWQWKDFAHVTDQSATFIAHQLMRKLAKDNDDATVVVVKYKGNGNCKR